ncbi:uncharacterized protein MELLADRAFT_96309 [Melampsora larici-populina 98AG31]|uniref:Uncharacterized protein n=1 Tax=Melampsora larici-populina (strain 98AG31 / pathotype 3-4-7) TaxID=747676 RepID=F4REB5_MELLP|nr:uncharacterized protein MELLADRAFT_96309 [Melampsora larici-populina 98AG31]EGG09297.1 hypothetical protein MELLADRAFT_96309 [Melampsora larici-populina 98AG31]
MNISLIANRLRLLSLNKLQSEIFQTTYNPHELRIGEKYLNRKLKGHLMRSYYPPIRPVNWKETNLIFLNTAKAEGITGRDLEYWKLPDLREEKR